MPGAVAGEWSLIGFTLLSQAGVGAYWTVGTAFILSGTSRGILENRILSVPILVAVLVLLGLAAAVSLFHLGRPGRAAFALNNLRRSWLSREVFFELAFLGMIAGLLILRWRNSDRTPFFQGIVLAAAITGAFFLFSMSKLYMLRTVPAWRGIHTPLSFFTSALLLGPLGVVAAQSRLFDFPGSAAVFRTEAVVVSLAAILLAIANMLLFTPRLGYFGVKTPTLLEYAPARMFPFLLFRLLYLGGALFFLFLYHKQDNSGYALLAFVCAAVAEVLGRYLFYAIYSRLGV